MNLIRLIIRCLAITTVGDNIVFGEVRASASSIQSPKDVFFQGREMLSIESKIVGGQPAGLTQFPYYGKLQSLCLGWKQDSKIRDVTSSTLVRIAQWWGSSPGTPDSISTCAATLVHSDIILSAAHCNGISENVNVVVGAYYPFSSVQGILRTVTDRIVNPNYNDVTIANDFLVLKLDSPVPTTPVTLNSDPTSPHTDEWLTIIGLGLTNETGQSSSELMQVSVEYVDPATCSDDYRSEIPINETVQLCAGVSGGGKGPCFGDSGGPVLNSHGVLVGLVSASAGCAMAGYPAINARVSGAITWIQQQVCLLSSDPPEYCPDKLIRTVPSLETSSATNSVRAMSKRQLLQMILLTVMTSSTLLIENMFA